MKRLWRVRLGLQHTLSRRAMPGWAREVLGQLTFCFLVDRDALALSFGTSASSRIRTTARVPLWVGAPRGNDACHGAPSTHELAAMPQLVGGGVCDKRYGAWARSQPGALARLDGACSWRHQRTVAVQTHPRRRQRGGAHVAISVCANGKSFSRAPPRAHPRRQRDGALLTLAEHRSCFRRESNASWVSAWKLVSRAGRFSVFSTQEKDGASTHAQLWVAPGVAAPPLPHAWRRRLEVASGAGGQWQYFSASAGVSLPSLVASGQALSQMAAECFLSVSGFLGSQCWSPQSKHEEEEPRAAGRHSDQLVVRRRVVRRVIPLPTTNLSTLEQVTRGVSLVRWFSAPISRPTPAAMGDCEASLSLSSPICWNQGQERRPRALWRAQGRSWTTITSKERGFER